MIAPQIDFAKRARLAVLSASALFLELALIRYLGSEVRVFAYFKNLILVACFLGFGLGFFRARARARLAASVFVTGAIVVAVRFGSLAGELGPQSASVAFSNFAGSLTMGEEMLRIGAPASTLVAGLGWTLGLFLSCMAATYGFAQRIGTDIEAFGPRRRIDAYSWNVLGSLVGILAFALVSRAAWGPLSWFVPVALATLPYVRGNWVRTGVLVQAVLLAGVLWPNDRVVWSGYQKLEWFARTKAISVNGTGYMQLVPFGKPPRPASEWGLDRWRLPHAIRRGARSVLVVGAGGGNDAAAALAAGAKRVVAVEIDPEIVRWGTRYHPDAPYSDSLVEIVIDDARRYGETSNERFDLIVFSHLDSHTALSGFTNIRLDNYIYTVESFRTFRHLLAPGGALYVSFWATRPWIATRLRENLTRAFGRPPIGLHDFETRGEHLINIAHYVASEDRGVRDRAEAVSRESFSHWQPPAAPEPSTDDWPYLFLEKRQVPRPQVLLELILALVVGFTIAAAVAGEKRHGGRWSLDRHFFLLGAAFLLVEVHNVGRLARVFGTTWSVNAWVIAGVLLVILAANYVASKRPSFAGGRTVYALLLANLLAGYFIPVNALLALPLAPVAALVFYTLPLFFAGLIFAGSFRAEPQPLRALGSNVLGSLLGGLLEPVSFVTGVSGLLLVATLLYAASFRMPRGGGVLPSVDGELARAL